MGNITCTVPDLPFGDYGNNTDNLSEQDYPSYDTEMDGDVDPYAEPLFRATFITFNLFVFLFGLTGNILVILVVLRNRTMKTTTNFFLVNLAVCDLLVTLFVVIPTMYRFVGDHYPFGCVFCKIEQVVFGTTIIASAAILTTIAIERYLVIMYPMRMRRVWTAKRMKIIVASIWVCSTLYSLSPIWYYGISVFNGLPFCMINYLYMDVIKKQTLISFILWYGIPLTLMIFLYGHMSVFLWHSAGAKNISIRETRNNMSNTSRANSNRKNIYKGGSQVRRTDSHNVSNQDEVKADKGIHKCGDFYIDYPDESEIGSSLIQKQHKNGTTEEREKFIDIKIGQDSPNVSVMYTKPNEGQKQQNNSNVRFIERTRKSTKKAPARRGLKALNERKKVIRLLIALVVSFALCLFPTHLTSLWRFYGNFPETTKFGYYSVPWSTAFYLMNSALNPMLYAFLSEQFRKRMKQTLMCKSQQRWERISGPRSNDSTLGYTDQTDT